MEQQHPIPQQISAYQFRLVGDMTLKQFFQVAGGALVALLIYSSNLSPYIKWPLIVFSFLFGVALAFFPLEDRPLSKWIFLFLRAIYSPTIYEWKKGTKKLIFFQPEPEEAIQEAAPETPSLLTTPSPELSKLEKGEQEFLTKVSQHFNLSQKPPPPLTIKDKPFVSAGASQVVHGEVKVPKTAPVEVEHGEKEVEQPKAPEATTPTLATGFEISPMAVKKTAGLYAAKFSQAASPPARPTRPNIIIGQVLDAEGNIVENAILEIRDVDGRPVRALKTNKLGHFMIVTPLANGDYEILTEKEGFTFDPITIEAKGEIIEPIAIHAKLKSENIDKVVN